MMAAVGGVPCGYFGAVFSFELYIPPVPQIGSWCACRTFLAPLRVPPGRRVPSSTHRNESPVVPKAPPKAPAGFQPTASTTDSPEDSRAAAVCTYRRISRT